VSWTLGQDQVCDLPSNISAAMATVSEMDGQADILGIRGHLDGKRNFSQIHSTFLAA
jgi:hypothetical protein